MGEEVSKTINSDRTFQAFGDYLKEVYKKSKNEKSDLEGGFLIPETIDIPINKWHDFKQRWFPKFLRRIFPIKTKEVNLHELFLEMANKEEINGKDTNNF